VWAGRAGRQEEAVTHYRSALQILLHPPLAATRVANKAAVTLRCNVAASLLKQGAASGAIDECTHALVMDKHHVKAMFRRAEAYRMLGLYSKAVADLDKARTLEPRNQAIQYAVRPQPPRSSWWGRGCACCHSPCKAVWVF
jgi:tetratricopeptide (TPR) repeat protein